MTGNADESRKAEMTAVDFLFRRVVFMEVTMDKDKDNDIEIIVEHEFVGTRPFEEVFNELNEEVIEQNAREYLNTVA